MSLCNMLVQWQCSALDATSRLCFRSHFGDSRHRRSQGVQWVHLHPHGGEIFFRSNLQEKCVSAPPRTRVHLSQTKSQFLGQFLLRGLDFEVDLDSLWGRRLKKVLNFFGKKCTPRQNHYAYDSRFLVPGFFAFPGYWIATLFIYKICKLNFKCQRKQDLAFLFLRLG